MVNRKASKFKPKRNVKAVRKEVSTSKAPVRKRISTGFPTLDGYTSDAEPEPSNDKKFTGKKKKSGGFQSMGLNRNVFGGILKKGYKIPTPIQRKSIPIIMEGKDVVAMARTGSGKTAAFLIPMLERLGKSSHSKGCRALILSPTRELAIQTLKFTKELGKLCRLKAELILGGDSLEEQFAALHTFPDILIATPGRLVHVMMEMDMKLSSVEYLVFDEADRLFEMGFAEQMQEILHRVPENRQTLLFSATLPKSLVEFARAGLHDPTLIRLDVDNKISQDLKMAHFYTRSSEKTAVLLHLLKNVVQPDELTVVFLATKHHVDYMREVLEAFDISCTFIFSALDPAARKINIAKFASKKTHILLVTDIAARGIDIPMLDNVINYNFPGKPKLFVHRVGRVARAGRTGTAYSLICPDEVPYFIDLHLFLGRPLKLYKKNSEKADDGFIGRCPREIIDEEGEHLRHHHEHSSDLISLRKVCDNAMKQYTKSRPLPSTASVKRSKEVNMELLLHHPIFGSTSSENPQVNLIDQMKRYKPNTTIFEINSTTKTTSKSVMLSKRQKHGKYIEKARQTAEEREEEADKMPIRHISDLSANAEELFSKVAEPGKGSGRSGFTLTKSGKQLFNSSHKDEEFYIPHVAPDHRTEMGLGVNSFEQQASEDVLEMTQDESRLIHKNQQKTKWDRKRKRFVGSGGKEKMKKIKTESGTYISSSYKKHIYQDWLERSKEEGVNFDNLANEFTTKGEDAEEDYRRSGVRSSGFRSRYRHKKGVEKGSGNVVDEVRTNEVILKGRKKMENNRSKNQPKKDKKIGGKKRKVRKDRYGAAVPLVYSGMNSGWKKKGKFGGDGEGMKKRGRGGGGKR